MPAMRHEAERARVLARELDEVRAHLGALLARPHHVRGRVLYAHDVLDFIELRHRVDGHVDHRAAGDVVDQDRQAGALGDRAEMRVEAVLGRLVVIRRDDQQAVRAVLLGLTRERDRLRGRVRARASDHRAAATRLLDAPAHDIVMLVMAHRRTLARGADGHEPVRSFGDLPVDQAAERALVELAVAHRRHKRGDGAVEHRSGHGVWLCVRFRGARSRPNELGRRTGVTKGRS